MTLATYRDYQRTARPCGAAIVVHGRYDGLATAPIAHPHAQLFIPLAGRVHVAPASGDGFLLGPEAALWLPAGLPHAASSLGGAVEFVALNLPPDWAPALAAAHGLPLPREGAHALPEPGLWLGARLLADRLGDPPGGDAFVEACLRQLGLLMLGAAGGAGATPPGEAAMRRVIEHVLRHHAEDLTVASLAASAGLGVRQLERRFLAAVGLSPRKFLIATRLAAARELLATSALGLEAIAERVGFADATHLTRSFRAAHGTTPAAWRRAHGAAPRDPRERRATTA